MILLLLLVVIAAMAVMLTIFQTRQTNLISKPSPLPFVFRDGMEIPAGHTAAQGVTGNDRVSHIEHVATGLRVRLVRDSQAGIWRFTQAGKEETSRTLDS